MPISPMRRWPGDRGGRRFIAAGLASRGLLGVIVCSLHMGTLHAQVDARVPHALREYVQSLLRRTGVPSVAIAKVERGRVVWSGAIGQQSAGVAATATTLYNVASLTKPVTAETVLRAAANRRLDLDEPMSSWWADPDIATDPRRLELTARLALTHRTGFPNWRRETAGTLTFRNTPGQTVGYSGEGFEYLARYAERRSRTSFEDLARELVFRPARMTATSFTSKPWFDGRIALPTDAEGHSLTPSIGQSFTASDDLYTTAGDCGRFLAGVAAHVGLQPAAAAERERVQVSTLRAPCPGPTWCPDAAGWGLGWDVVVFGDDRILWHTGADRGEFCFAYVIPRSGEGAVILTNSAVGYKMVIPILEQLGAHEKFLAYLRALAG